MSVAELRKPPTAEAAVAPDPLAKLREPFPANQVSKLPKESRKQIDERKANPASGVACKVCGSWHHKSAVHLDYVGHAAATDRLLDADPRWNWEPMAYTAEGLPAFDRNGGLWIKLTVDGVTRIGYGAADGKTGGDAIKEIIGDCLRNAGMRFGMALDLWHKGDLHADDEASQPTVSAEELAINHLRSCTANRAIFTEAWEKNRAGWKGVMDDAAYARVVSEMKRLAATIPADDDASTMALGDDEIPAEFA